MTGIHGWKRLGWGYLRKKWKGGGTVDFKGLRGEEVDLGIMGLTMSLNCVPPRRKLRDTGDGNRALISWVSGKFLDMGFLEVEEQTFQSVLATRFASSCIP